MKTLNITVFGRVQGVSYRHFCRKTAQQLGIAGSARNSNNGTVRIVVQGNQKALEHFIVCLRKGTEHSRVEDLEITETKLERLECFEIEH